MKRTIDIPASVLRMLIALPLLAATGCGSDDTALPTEPTAESIVISGRIATTGDAPLSRIPLRVDYETWSSATPQRRIRKAEAVTDDDGHYRIFFDTSEPTPPATHRAFYNLYADLGGLSARDYILPSDADAANGTETLLVQSYTGQNKGSAQEINLHVPRKRVLTVHLTGYDEADDLYVGNTIRYGNDRARMLFPARRTADGDRTATVTCALGETNSLTVEGPGKEPEEPLELFVDEECDTQVTIASRRVPKAARFRLTKAGHSSLMGEEYPLPAPFDLITFRITAPDGRYDPLGFPDYTRYYDSIVWRAEGLPDTMPIYRSRHDGQGSEERFSSQWSSYFFRSGQVTSYAAGYRGGEAVYADTLRLALYERDFLCFDWEEGNVSLTGGYDGVYCRLDRSREYRVCHTEQTDGTRYARIAVAHAGELDDEAFAGHAREALLRLMEENLGRGQSGEGNAGAFVCLPEGAEPVWYWENATTRIMLLHEPATEFERETYRLHVEAARP